MIRLTHVKRMINKKKKSDLLYLSGQAMWLWYAHNWSRQQSYNVNSPLKLINQGWLECIRIAYYYEVIY